MVPFSRKPDEPAEPERPHYYSVDLSPYMRDELLKIVERCPKTGTTKGLTEALELAERIDLPFTPPVDWDKLERMAQRGYAIPDQIYDAKRKEP